MEWVMELSKLWPVSYTHLVIAGKNAIDSAEQGVKNAKRAVEDAGSGLESQLVSAKRSVDSADRGVTQAENKANSERKSSMETRQQAQIEKLGYLSERRVKEKEREALETLAENDGILVSPIDGSVPLSAHPA